MFQESDSLLPVCVTLAKMKKQEVFEGGEGQSTLPS